MGRLSVFENDEEMLLTNLSFTVRKNVRPKKLTPQIWVLGREICCVKKVTNIQIVTHPYLGRWSKNLLEVSHDDIAVCKSHEKCIFDFYPKID